MAPRRFQPGLRLKLSLLGLSLAAAPWAGYRALHEMEQFLRAQQEQRLLERAALSAQVLAESPAMVRLGARSLRRAQAPAPVHPLPREIALDGLAEDWGELLGATLSWSADPPMELLAGRRGAHDYFLLTLPSDIDALELAFYTPGQHPLRYRILIGHGGGIATDRLSDAEPPRPERAIQGYARPSDRNRQTLELRLPDYLAGPRIALRPLPDTQPSAPPAPEEFRWLLTGDPELDQALTGLTSASYRLWVTDPFGFVLAAGGDLRHQGADSDDAAVGRLRQLFRRLIRGALEPSHAPPRYHRQFGLLDTPEISTALADTPATLRFEDANTREPLLSAAYPIRRSGLVIGALVVEQSTLPILAVQERSLERLLITTAPLFGLSLLLLLGFAARLALRIRRLRDGVARSVSGEGRIQGALPAERAGDELGDLSRAFSDILRRLAEYNHSLENLASRLAHELRTPLTVMRSSLELLQGEHPEDPVLQRALLAGERLQLIIHRLREATRLEQLLSDADKQPIELGGLLQSAVEGYREAFPELSIRFTAPPAPVRAEIAPDLLIQALDKLLANAADFRAPDTPIEIRLHHGRNPLPVQISITNQGPSIPAGKEREIFQSMISHRNDPGAEPHLGLGLYLVRLICEFHGGRVEACNLADGAGVEIRMEFPLLQPTQ